MALFDDWEGFDYQAVKKEGNTQGGQKKLIQIVGKKMSVGQSPEKIADDLMEDTELIRKIYDVLENMGTDCDIDTIFCELEKNKDKTVASNL